MTVRKSRSIRILPRKVTVAEENSGERDGRNHPTRLSIYPHFALSDVTRQRPCIFCALLTVTLRGHMEQWMAARRAISGCKSIFGDFEEGALTPTAHLRVDDSLSLSYQWRPSIYLSLQQSHHPLTPRETQNSWWNEVRHMWWRTPFPASQLTNCTSDLAGQEGRYPFVSIRAATDVAVIRLAAFPYPSLLGLLLLLG